MNKLSKLVPVCVAKRFCGRFVAGTTAVLASAGAALAEPTLTVPDIDKIILFDAAGKAFAVAAVVVAIYIGLRLFKSR